MSPDCAIGWELSAPFRGSFDRPGPPPLRRREGVARAEQPRRGPSRGLITELGKSSVVASTIVPYFAALAVFLALCHRDLLS